MVIHELFTPEDTNYLVDFARPRLSRKRDIVNAEDKTFRKAEELNRQTVSNASNLVNTQRIKNIGCWTNGKVGQK